MTYPGKYCVFDQHKYHCILRHQKWLKSSEVSAVTEVSSPHMYARIGALSHSAEHGSTPFSR